ncbi:auxin response factor 7 [Selaginella moellendorffii]|uniref:auxin response factor 7 n=1 Tax=Selaginella moellendorffii TaxID=88036 RepID=UPI000D1D0F5B|nr:auxin response factor 7 [Selaginella moellendorffii]|eukprot:XP_002982925.2 auxin response factor 7 [Selaginella moellendorffii]
MDCPTRKRKNSISSEEELRKMSRVSWIQDPQGMNLQQQQQQQQQQQLLDHQMLLRLQHHQQQQHQHHHQQQQQQLQHQHQQHQKQQQQRDSSDQIPVVATSAQAGAALSLQQRAMAAIALQEIRSSIDTSKLGQQHHKYHPPVAATTTITTGSGGATNNPPSTPQSFQSHQNPSFTTNSPLSMLDTRSLYPPSLHPLSSSISTTSDVALVDPLASCSSSKIMMMPSQQLMMSIPPVIFPSSLINPPSSSSTPPPAVILPSTPPPKPVSKPVTTMSSSPMRSTASVPDFKDLQQQSLKSSPSTATTKWFASPPPPGALAANLAGSGAGIWLGGDFNSTVNVTAALDHHHQQQQQLHHHHHLHQELMSPENSVILQQDPQTPVATTSGGGCFSIGPGVANGSHMMMPPSGNFRSQGGMSIAVKNNMPLSPSPAVVDQVIADLKNIVSSSSPDSCIVADSSSKQPKPIHQPPQQQQQLQHQRQRTFTKVYKLGSIGRAVDVARFKNYVELRAELSRMFGLDGQLDQRNGWQLVFVDKENDLLLVGDDPWEEFVSSVRGIRILSPSEVSYYTSDERSAEIV